GAASEHAEPGRAAGSGLGQADALRTARERLGRKTRPGQDQTAEMPPPHIDRIERQCRAGVDHARRPRTVLAGSSRAVCGDNRNPAIDAEAAWIAIGAAHTEHLRPRLDDLRTHAEPLDAEYRQLL